MLVMNEMALERLCEALVEANGLMPLACKRLGVPIRQVDAWLARDPEVRLKVQEAQKLGYSTIEEEVRRRAIEGVEVPVYQKGELVGYRTEYSDSLLALMAKSRVPGYKQEDGSTGHGVTVNVAVMPRANSYEEWVVQRDIELDRTAVAALPARPVEDAVFEDVQLVSGASVLKDIL